MAAHCATAPGGAPASAIIVAPQNPGGSLIPRLPWLATAATFAVLASAGAGSGAPDSDPAGRFAGHAEAGADTLGTPCGACADPVVASYIGVAFKGDALWLVTKDGTMLQMSGCSVVQTVSIQGFRGYATDLGWDGKRGVFIVTDVDLDELLTVRPDGTVVSVRPSPGAGPIGADYDTTRDVYWISDWEENAIYAVDPETGAPIESFAVPAGSRVAGLGYDPARDALYYNGRNQRTCYAVSAKTHQLLGAFALPSGGLENGEGIGIAPDGRLWIHISESASIACFLNDASTPTRATTWGELKRRYLR